MYLNRETAKGTPKLPFQSASGPKIGLVLWKTNQRENGDFVELRKPLFE